MQQNDPQAEQETNRQRAYGEQARERAKDLNDQATPSIGVRVGDDEDHGFRRDDEDTPETEDPVVAASDERHPNVPDHADSDFGPKA